MLSILNENPDAEPEEVLRGVMRGINTFMDGAEQFDDITMLCFRYNGPVNADDDKQDVSVSSVSGSTDLSGPSEDI